MEEYTHLLDKMKPDTGSGVQDFDKATFEKLKKNKNKLSQEISSEVFDSCLDFFEKGEYSELLDYLYEDPSRIASNQVKAIKFFAELRLGFNPSFASLIKRDSFYDYKKDLKFSEALIDLSKKLQIEDIDFFQYTEKLAPLSYSYIKAQLFDNSLDLKKEDYEKFLEKLNESFLQVTHVDDEEVKDHYEERILYLKALIYKKLDDKKNATKYIGQYLEKSFNLEEKISKLVLLKNEELFSADELLSKLKLVYDETREINDFIAETSLLTKDTCSSYSCDDCCRYTYPSLSLTEFEYIKNWGLENGFDFSAAIARAQKIQEEYQKKSGEVFKIEEKKGVLDLNSVDYKFDCPFLEEGRCSIHEARPLLCRVFGSGTTDAKHLKSCNYYLNQYQYMSSPEHERLVYDARGFQAALEESDKYLTQSDTAKVGLIPAFLMYFAQNLE